MSAPRYPLHARVTELEAMRSVLDGKIDRLQVAVAAMSEKETGKDCALALALSPHAEEMLAESRRRAAWLAELDRQRGSFRHGMRLVKGDGEDTGAGRAELSLVVGGDR